jgi:hypothetical protein
LFEHYFDPEGNAKFRQESLDFDPDPENPYRMGILMAVQESEKAEREQDIVEARLGSPMEEAVKIERYNRRAIEMVPEFWLPDVVHVTDLDRLKRIINENSVQELIEAEGVEDIDQASAMQLKTALSSIKKKFPPRIWREEGHDYKSDKI